MREILRALRALQALLRGLDDAPKDWSPYSESEAQDVVLLRGDMELWEGGTPTPEELRRVRGGCIGCGQTQRECPSTCGARLAGCWER